MLQRVTVEYFSPEFQLLFHLPFFLIQHHHKSFPMPEAVLRGNEFFNFERRHPKKGELDIFSRQFRLLHLLRTVPGIPLDCLLQVDVELVDGAGNCGNDIKMGFDLYLACVF